MKFWRRLILRFSKLLPQIGRGSDRKEKNSNEVEDNGPVAPKKEEATRQIGTSVNSLPGKPKSLSSDRLRRYIEEKEHFKNQYEKASNRSLNFSEIPSALLSQLRKALSYDSNEPTESKAIARNQKKLDDFEYRNIAIKKQLALLQDYSLVDIKSQRIEREKILLQEKLAKERLQLVEKALNKITNAIDENNFDLAKELISSAVKDFPEKATKIQKTREVLTKREVAWQKKKEEFSVYVAEGDSLFRKVQYDAAIEKYKLAERLDFNITLIRQKIAVAQQKIATQKKLAVEIQLQKREKLKYKVDRVKIQKILREQGISCFYHYTDSANLNSIIQNGGIFSLAMLKKKKIAFVRGSETSEKPDYVRLSYGRWHPLLFKSQKEGRIRNVRTIEVDPEVGSLKETLFTNVNAARTSSPPIVMFGDDANFLAKEVRFSIVKGHYSKNWPASDKAYYQAEVMVKEKVELKYLKNI